jgi:hypothetical protein
MANYAFVVDNSFQPFSMQEMLVPFSAYKDAYEKSEEQYNDLSDKSDKFKYLSETLPEGSKARKLYEGYANDLARQAEDLAHNGLSMSNRRALTSLRRRYQGEIGRLLQADEAMREEKKLRRSLSAQDSSMLYAIDNLDIDSFLDGESPNLYNISGNELYTRGAAAGKASSSRVFSAGDAGSTLNGYYRDYVQKLGYSRDTIQKFYQDMSIIPELQMAADAILEERGVNQNLTGNNLQRARQSVINGMIDGAIYQENHNLQRDLGVLTETEKQQMDLTRRGQNISLASQGLTYDENTGTISYDPTKDPSLQKASAIAQAKVSSAGKKTGSGTAYDVRNKEITMIGAKTGTKYKDTNDESSIGAPLEDLSGARALSSQEYSQLVDANGNITNEHLRSAIGNGNLSDYEIYVVPAGTSKIDSSGIIWDDSTTEDVYIAIPRESKRAATNSESSINTSYSGDNDIPK